MAVAWAWAYGEDIQIAITTWNAAASAYDSVVASVTSANLDENVPLQDSSKTPQYNHVGEGLLDRGEIEMLVIEFTNEERRKAGLKLLQHDPAISAIARSHSENMAERSALLHDIGGKDATDRAMDAGYNCRAYHGDGSFSYGLSENIAEHPRVTQWMGRGRSYHPVDYNRDAKDAAQELVQGWMTSSGHRENILDKDSYRIGVGVAVQESTEYGYISETVYATQDFSTCR